MATSALPSTGAYIDATSICFPEHSHDERNSPTSSDYSTHSAEDLQAAGILHSMRSARTPPETSSSKTSPTTPRNSPALCPLSKAATQPLTCAADHPEYVYNKFAKQEKLRKAKASPSPSPATPVSRSISSKFGILPTIYAYDIKSKDNPELQQADPHCWAGEPIPEKKLEDHGDLITWRRLLNKLGLTPGEFPAIEVEGMMKHPGKRGKPDGQAPSWNYLIYTLIAVSPQGRLKQNTLYNLCLAWCQILKPNNKTCRHGLCTWPQFYLEPDPNDSANGGWYRLSRPGEVIIVDGKKVQLGRKRQGEDEEETEDLGFSVSGTAGSSPQTKFNHKRQLTNSNCSIPTTETKQTAGNQKRKRSDAECEIEATDAPMQDGGGPGPQTESNRKRQRVCSINDRPSTTAPLVAASTGQAESSKASENRLENFREFEQFLDGWIATRRGRNKELFGYHHPRELYEIVRFELDFAAGVYHRTPCGPRGEPPQTELPTADQVQHSSPRLSNGRTPLSC